MTFTFAAMFCVAVLVVSAAAAEDFTRECISAATFNTALLRYVPDYDIRKSQMPEVLSAQPLHVMCLQEVWLESDMHHLVDSLRQHYPHSYSAIHHSEAHIRKPESEMSWWEVLQFRTSVFSPCSLGDGVVVASRILPCAIWNGCLVELAESAPKGVQCLSEKCTSAMQALQPDCLSCLALQGGKAAGITQACLPNPFNRFNSFNTPGLLLLSALPLESVSYTPFFPDKQVVTSRGYIEASLQGGGGDLKVACTHLSSAFPYYYEYDLDFGTWEFQHAAEVQVLGDAFPGMDHVLLGDFNTGPAVRNNLDAEKNLTGEFAKNYDSLIEFGYVNKYFGDDEEGEEEDGRCTYCSDNPLHDDIAEDTNVAIDHVLVKGGSVVAVGPGRRTLDQTLPTGTPLSDHYGVEQTVCFGLDPPSTTTRVGKAKRRPASRRQQRVGTATKDSKKAKRKGSSFKVDHSPLALY